MNKLFLFLFSVLLLIITVLSKDKILFNQLNSKPAVYLTTSDSFKIPRTTKNLGLLGCTPHPTEYVKRQNGKINLKNIKLSDFIDTEDLKDSFKQVITLCINTEVDTLLIAYLPIYFVHLKKELNQSFIKETTNFLQSISPEIKTFIFNIAKKLNFSGKIYIILPQIKQLQYVPNQIRSFDDRVRFLIKQFPKLKNINQSKINAITIINNKDSEQNSGLIDYLKYEYLFSKPIEYKIISTNKKHFHKYI